MISDGESNRRSDGRLGLVRPPALIVGADDVLVVRLAGEDEGGEGEA